MQRTCCFVVNEESFDFDFLTKRLLKSVNGAVLANPLRGSVLLRTKGLAFFGHKGQLEKAVLKAERST